MKLYAHKSGTGRPLLILHGLFGMSDNWRTIAEMLTQKGFAVHLLDMRNHGRSPHMPTHTYPDMCDDLNIYLEQEKLAQVSIMGHSMGGKTAMFFGLLHPEKIKHLAVIDIAPASYAHHNASHHSNIINNLMAIDLSAYQNRQALTDEIQRRLNDYALAMFLGKSITRDAQANFKWKLNLPILLKYLPSISVGLEDLKPQAPSPVETLFIRGEHSDYIRPEHEPERMTYYPRSKIITIDNAGHWLHAEQPEKLATILSTFFMGEGR